MEEAALFVVVHRVGGEHRFRTRARFSPPTSGEPMALTLGRHVCCDLPGLRHASLRHVLVIAWPDGLSPLEVVDLRSNTGLVVSSGKSVARLRGQGPMRFTAGSDEVTVLYAAPDAPLEVDLPDELDGWIDIEERRMFGDLSLGGGALEPARNASFVTRAGETLIRVADRRVLNPASHEVIPARASDLREGLLLGRYPRCDNSGTFSRDDLVSRVHAFVIEHDGRLHVIDVGSTNGTKIIDADDGRVQRRLDDQHRVHTLGSRQQIRLASTRVAIELCS